MWILIVQLYEILQIENTGVTCTQIKKMNITKDPEAFRQYLPATPPLTLLLPKGIPIVLISNPVS